MGAKISSKKKPPETFRPFLWSLRWNDIDAEKDKEDIIVNTINEGSLDHWRWIIQTYGKKTIAKILAKHLESEFHPESRNLAKIIFPFSQFRNAR